MDTHTTIMIVVSIYAVGFIIVASDHKFRHVVVNLWPIIPAIVIALPLLWCGVLVYESDKLPLVHAMEGLDHLLEELWDSSPVLGFLATIPALLLFLILGLLAPFSDYAVYGVAAVAGVYLLITVVVLAPILVLVPVVAAHNVARGFGVTIGQMFFFFTQPHAVRDIKRAINQQNMSQHDTVRYVNKKVNEEKELALKVRWWRPRFSIFTSFRHYNALAEYIRSLSRVTEATEDHLRKTWRRDDGKRD